MSGTISIQPGQPGRGMEYDVHLRLPYPYHIDAETGECTHGMGTNELMQAPEGKPWRLVGFQRGDEQAVVLVHAQFVANPAAAVGLVPVFYGGSAAGESPKFFALRVPVIDVTDHRTIKAVTP